MSALHMLGDRLPERVLGLSMIFNDWRGRTDGLDGRRFVLVGRDPDFDEWFVIDVWTGRGFKRVDACDDEIFHELRTGKDLHERTTEPRAQNRKEPEQ